MNGAPAWQSALQDALKEKNPEEIRTKIRKAEAAIFEKIQTPWSDRDDEEERALFTALGTLRALIIRRIPA